MNGFVSKKITENLPYEALYRLNVNQDIDKQTAYESLKKIFEISDEKKSSTLLSMLLNGIMVKGAKLDEIIGLLKAALSLDSMLESKKPKIVLPNEEKLIGCAGSGKKGIKTINISTPAAIVAASCGVYTAKACSHSTSSMTGSSDFLLHLGMNIDFPIEKKIDLLTKTGVAFFKIEDATPRFAQVYGGRFFAPHALSYALAGLSLPIDFDVLLYGLSHPNIRLSIETFEYFGFKNAMVVTTTEDGIHYIDEVGISGTISVIGIKDGILGRAVMCSIKEELGFEKGYTMTDIKQMNSPEENVRTAIVALTGSGNESYIDLISVNAGMLTYLARKVKNLKEGYCMAKKSIYNGKAFEKLLEVVELSEGNAIKLRKIKKEC